MNKKEQSQNLLKSYIAALLGGGALGAGLGAAGGSILFEASEDSKPGYAQRMTSEEHAIRDAAQWSRDTPRDYISIQGIRQALMGGRLTADQLDEMLLAQEFSPRVEFLTGDIHNFGKQPGRYNDPRRPAMTERFIAEKEKNNKELGL